MQIENEKAKARAKAGSSGPAADTGAPGCGGCGRAVPARAAGRGAYTGRWRRTGALIARRPRMAGTETDLAGV